MCKGDEEGDTFWMHGSVPTLGALKLASESRAGAENTTAGVM